MPYTVKSSGDKIKVYKKGTNQLVGTTTKDKIKAYLGALYSNVKHESVNEDSQQLKTSKIKAAQAKVDSLKLQLRDAMNALNKIKATPVGADGISEAFTFSTFAKSILEADATDIPDPEADGTDTADTKDTTTADTEKSAGNVDSEKEASSNQSLTVKFNMAKVKKYNNFPVIDNTGTVTGVSKDGLVVQVGDNVVVVNFDDLLN